MTEKPIIIKTANEDNVGIVVNLGGLPSGTILENGIKLSENIPIGHKVALSEIKTGVAIIRYGHVIGYAASEIKPGDWIKESLVTLPQPPDLDSITFTDKPVAATEPLTGYTFKGYRNPDGSVGTRNILGITTSVNCVTGFAEHIADKVKKELLHKYPNVDDVVALNHSYGCGVAIEAPDSVIPIRTLRNIAQNPNFGGRIMVVGLGCEKLIPNKLFPLPDNSAKSIDSYISSTTSMQDEVYNGYQEMLEGAVRMAEDHLKELDKRNRETCPASELIVGMQCGGSDSFSGITSNPVAGFASDLIVRAGGAVMFSEVTEVRDAIHLLVPRALNSSVAKALVDEMKWYDEYLQRGGADRSANTAPGNKSGGLSNIVEKAMGSVAKSGSSPIVDVLGPGEKIRRKGLIFAATPASDFVCGTLQLAAGMNMHVFMTGRGTPYGLSMVPVIKVGSNSRLSKRWFDLIDLDAGQVALGRKTIEEMGWELFRLILDVASGEKQVACDKLGLHNDLVLFNPGPLT